MGIEAVGESGRTRGRSSTAIAGAFQNQNDPFPSVENVLLNSCGPCIRVAHPSSHEMFELESDFNGGDSKRLGNDEGNVWLLLLDVREGQEEVLSLIRKYGFMEGIPLPCWKILRTEPASHGHG